MGDSTGSLPIGTKGSPEFLAGRGDGVVRGASPCPSSTPGAVAELGAAGDPRLGWKQPSSAPARGDQLAPRAPWGALTHPAAEQEEMFKCTKRLWSPGGFHCCECSSVLQWSLQIWKARDLPGLPNPPSPPPPWEDWERSWGSVTITCLPWTCPPELKFSECEVMALHALNVLMAPA